MDASDNTLDHTESDTKMGYAKPVAMIPARNKYKCMATGEKRSEPCASCPDSNACMTDSLQIKEPTVDGIDEKSVVKISADGEIVSCAKGLDGTECGYKPGAKVCGKCGAMAAQVKFTPGARSESGDTFEFAKTKGDGGEYCQCGTKAMIGEDGMCEDCGKPPMPVEDTDDAVDAAEDAGAPVEEEVAAKGAYNQGMTHVDDPMDDEFKKRRKARHKQRIASMGIKSDDLDDDVFMCASTREVKSAIGASPCAMCTGGCLSMDANPDLLEIEAMAEDVIGGKALYSAYGDEFDMFAVQVRRKDGQAVEAYFTGTGDLDGWLRIPESELHSNDTGTVDIAAAVNAALDTVDGKALAVAIGRFEDVEAYIVEIEGIDGKSYDVAVARTGDVLGYDQHDVTTKTETVTAETGDVAADEIDTKTDTLVAPDLAEIETALLELSLIDAEDEIGSLLSDD